MAVFVGVNGAGKTSVLDGLAILLSLWNSEAQRAKVSREYQLTGSDILVGAPHTEVSISVEVGGKAIQWSSNTLRSGYIRPPGNSIAISTIQDVLLDLSTSDTEEIRIPLAVYYGINRTFDGSIQEARGFDPRHAFEQALHAGASFGAFFGWFRQREDLENEQRVRRGQLEYKDPQLQAVRTAIERLVPGVSHLQFQRAVQRMTVRKDEVELDVSQLSDGEKNLLAMAGDLARRLALANPGMEDPLSGEAVVLIDEIELHLHPGWQRRVIGSLRQAFPNCQFILTTHSPQVLSQVPTDSVILLEQFQRVTLPAGTEGRDSNSILAEVMQVPDRPTATADSIHRIAELIDQEDLPGARAALDELARQLGEHDSEVVRLRSLIGFLGG